MLSFRICMLSFSFLDDVLLRDSGFDNSCFGFLFIRNHVPLGSLQALLQLHCAVCSLAWAVSHWIFKEFISSIDLLIYPTENNALQWYNPFPLSLYLEIYQGSDMQLAYDNQMMIVYRDNCSHGLKGCNSAARMNYFFLSQNISVISYIIAP